MESIRSEVRHRVLEFLIYSSQQLLTPPIVKYTALSFYADRFLLILPGWLSENDMVHWLLAPLTESNLELFALISIWISSKIHDSKPLSVKSLKSLGDEHISDQHFTSRDFVEAEMVFMEELSNLGELVRFGLCMDIMDLLYEMEESSLLFRSPCFLAATILVVAYVLSVPKRQWEFPILPWVKFVTSYNEQDVEAMAMNILMYVMRPDMEGKDCRSISFQIFANNATTEDWPFSSLT